MKFLILTDGKAGHENQSRALASALGGEADVVEIRFRSRFHKAMSYLLDFFGIRTTSLVTGLSEALLRPGYAGVLGTGSGTFYAAKSAARRLGVRCAVVLYPRGYRISSFDCVLAPAFDQPARLPNVIVLPANLVSGDAAFYARGVEAFRARHIPSLKPKVAVIIGGPNKCSTMTPEWTKASIDRVFAENPDSEFWVTTSRRTPPDVESVVDGYPWAYRLLYSKDRFNPIPAFVQLAQRLYVTAESTGMLSEACTFGTAEVKALDNLLPGPHKFRRFIDDLRAAHYVDGTRKVDLAEPIAQARRLLGV